MTINRTLPLVATTVAALFAGATVALAQDTTSGTVAADDTATSVEPTDGRMIRTAGDRDRDGHRGGRHGGRHGKGSGGRGMMRQLLENADADGDGAVTQAEIDAFRTAQVSAADASGDGALSIEEFDTLYRAFTRTAMVDAFQALDEDGDGVISEAELDARVGSIVERMDRDDDGALTLEDRGRGRRG